MPPAKKVAKATSTPTDDPYVTTLLGKISEGMHVMSVRKGETIVSQGDRADAIYFIQSGRVKVSVASSSGKEAVLAILGPHGFFGDDSLVGQSLRLSTATTLEPATVFRVEKRAMFRALHAQPDLSERFMASLVKRNIDLEEDLCDQLFNHSEKRLARVLLKLARMRECEVVPDARITTLSHETLAEMVGTTRSRITHFMNKFRAMGLIEYNGHSRDNAFELIVRTERLTDLVLRD
jgi:CRP/FNR family transcriptional regulator, cyclic AMP receptor protein